MACGTGVDPAVPPESRAAAPAAAAPSLAVVPARPLEVRPPPPPPRGQPRPSCTSSPQGPESACGPGARPRGGGP